MFVELRMLNGEPVLVNPALVKVIRSYGVSEDEKPLVQIDYGDTDVIVPGNPGAIAELLSK